jgi:hypothetical protein
VSVTCSEIVAAQLEYVCQRLPALLLGKTKIVKAEYRYRYSWDKKWHTVEETVEISDNNYELLMGISKHRKIKISHPDSRAFSRVWGKEWARVGHTWKELL